MRITLSNQSIDFFDDAFYNPYSDEFDVDLISSSSSRVVIENSDSGHRTTFLGTGLVASNDDDDIRGTVSSIEFRDENGTLIASMTDINWSLRDLVGALDDTFGDGDDRALMDLLGQNGEVRVDTTAATGPTEIFLDNLTVPVRFVGGSQDDEIYSGFSSDRIETGAGDDYINPGDSYYGEDTVDPGLGNDIVDASEMDTGFLDIRHEAMVRSGHGMRFDIDGHDNTAQITKLGGNGTTEIVDVAAAMEADGLSLAGTDSDDVFNVTITDRSWVMLRGGRGDDTFAIGPSWGTVRLDYRYDNAGDAPNSGIVANLSEGVVSNDGFGGTDTIATAVAAVGYPDIVPYGPVTVELRGTALSDRMIGSDSDERFIGLGGTDTIDGAGGWDLLRFDQSGIDGPVHVDLGEDFARGSYQGTPFQHTIRNIEELRGSRDHGDMLEGSLQAETFFGRGGDDAIFGDGFEASYAMDEAATIYRLYQATLDRAPDANGLSNWSERLFTGERGLQEVASGFVNSPEFRATYGALDNEDFVSLLYQNVLDRAPDAQGLTNWTERLEDGMSQAQVVLGFSQSAEFEASTAADARAFTNATSQAGWGDDVYRIYQATLDRAPDATGFENWSGRLADGMALETVINGFVNSPEFKATYGALDNEGFVDLLYQNVLDRPADATGLANWTGRLDDGMSRAEVVRGFAQSPEFTAATADDLKAWIRNIEHVEGDRFHDWMDGEEGNNLLAGGMYADVFDFDQGRGGSHVVVDLEPWDYIGFADFGYASEAEAKAQMRQSGSDVVFEDQGVEITFTDTRLAEITHDMISF